MESVKFYRRHNFSNKSNIVVRLKQQVNGISRKKIAGVIKDVINSR